MSEKYVAELSGLPYFWGNHVKPCSFPIFNFSSLVNGPRLMSICLLIILVICSCVTFGVFPSRFSKCCFHSFILSCWFVAFNLALAVLFLLLTTFIVYHAILDCLYSTESLILSIWFCIYSVCSFRYMLVNSFCAFFSFKAFVFVRFFLLHLEAVFTSARFSLTANVFHGTLDLVLIFFGMYFAAASIVRWRNSHIRHSEFVFLSFSAVHRICFSMLPHIQL